MSLCVSVFPKLCVPRENELAHSLVHHMMTLEKKNSSLGYLSRDLKWEKKTYKLKGLYFFKRCDEKPWQKVYFVVL